MNIAGKYTYIGLGLVALATLMYEILLTRIFSVTMWYHFAFVAISIAMFGMTVGAIIVYLAPSRFPESRAKEQMSGYALAFSITVVLSFFIHVLIPFKPSFDLWGILSVVATYAVISVPFVASGITVSLALTRFPKRVGSLYAADLLGAGLGCILLIMVLNVADGPSTVVFVSFLAAASSFFFSLESESRNLKLAAVFCAIVFLLGFASNSVLYKMDLPALRLMWVKDRLESKPLYEKWNSFSRVSVFGDPDRQQHPFGWGLSPAFESAEPISQLHLNIDASAGTKLTEFSGNLGKLDFLRYDITNLVHHLRPNSTVMVVGVGGGRDILSAMLFDQEEIWGIEINEDIIKAVNSDFGDYTGHLDRYSHVHFINDEARSYISRMDSKFDMIQVSLIDTWAATAAGAFALTENTLYTVEAWNNFLEHLEPGGVLSFSRWYFRDNPGEMYRVASLAAASLSEIGVEDPRGHVMIVRNMQTGTSLDDPDGVGTILVSRDPFTLDDSRKLIEVANDMEFEIVVTPDYSIDDRFSRILDLETYEAEVAGFELDISAPTDNSPYFFHMLRLRDIFNTKLHDQGVVSFNMKAVVTLGILLLTVVILTALCIIVPLAVGSGLKNLHGNLPLLAYFASIGFGFMLVEISQMQRFTVFLGHPVYGLSVILFVMLISGGIGSHLSSYIKLDRGRKTGYIVLLSLIVMILVFGLATPAVISAFASSTTPMRIIAAVMAFFPLGMLMGTAFPIGMRLSSRRKTGLGPWLWGINGATSVCASVLAVVISLSFSISTAYYCGLICYCLAFLSFWLYSKK